MSWDISAYPRDLDVTRVAVPTSLTNITALTAELWEISVNNTTGGGITFLVQDKQASPLAVVPTVTIPAATADLIVYNGTGERCPGGVSWQAGSAGLVATVRGRTITGWTQAVGSQYVNSTNT